MKGGLSWRAPCSRVGAARCGLVHLRLRLHRSAMITTSKKLEQSHPLCSALHLLMFSLQTNSFVVIPVVFRHASVSRTYPCKLVSWLVGQSVTLSDIQSLVVTCSTPLPNRCTLHFCTFALLHSTPKVYFPKVYFCKMTLLNFHCPLTFLCNSRP